MWSPEPEDADSGLACRAQLIQVAPLGGGGGVCGCRNGLGALATAAALRGGWRRPLQRQLLHQSIQQAWHQAMGGNKILIEPFTVQARLLNFGEVAALQRQPPHHSIHQAWHQAALHTGIGMALFIVCTFDVEHSTMSGITCGHPAASAPAGGAPRCPVAAPADAPPSAPRPAASLRCRLHPSNMFVLCPSRSGMRAIPGSRLRAATRRRCRQNRRSASEYH